MTTEPRRKCGHPLGTTRWYPDCELDEQAADNAARRLIKAAPTVTAGEGAIHDYIRRTFRPESQESRTMPTDAQIDAVCAPGRAQRWRGDGRQYDRDTARLVLSKLATPIPAPPAVSFDDPRVQAAYNILCDGVVPPDGEHWEGFVARRIIAALADHRTVAVQSEVSAEPVAFTDHEHNIIADLEAMASSRAEGFWPQMLAIGALGIIKRLRATPPTVAQTMIDAASRIVSMHADHLISQPQPFKFPSEDWTAGFKAGAVATHRRLKTETTEESLAELEAQTVDRLKAVALAQIEASSGDKSG